MKRRFAPPVNPNVYAVERGPPQSPVSEVECKSGGVNEPHRVIQYDIQRTGAEGLFDYGLQLLSQGQKLEGRQTATGNNLPLQGDAGVRRVGP